MCIRDRYLAVGAGLPRFLKVPGENLPGVYCANEYLTRTNLMHCLLYTSRCV